MKKRIYLVASLITLLFTSVFADTDRSCTYAFRTGDLQKTKAFLGYDNSKKYYDVVTYQIKDKGRILGQTSPRRSNTDEAFLTGPCTKVKLFAILGKENKKNTGKTPVFHFVLKGHHKKERHLKEHQGKEQHYMFPSPEWEPQRFFF